MLLPAITFAITAAIICGAYWFLVAAPEAREHSALKRRLKSESVSVSKLTLARDEQTLSDISLLNTMLARFEHLVAPIKRMIGESNLPINVGTFMLMSITALLVGAVAAQQLVSTWWVIVVGAALVAALVPTVVVRIVRSRRLNKFEEQFPEAIELISRALRAGHAFATGLKIAADEMPAPVGPEFKLLFERQNYGAQINDALRSFGERVPLLDARFFVTAVMTQRETGGNLSEVLDRLASVMRERFKIRREVRTKSAHGRVTAYILAALPPTLAAILMVINPEQMQIMVTDPLGQQMLMTGVALQVLGTLIVRKIVDIQY